MKKLLTPLIAALLFIPLGFGAAADVSKLNPVQVMVDSNAKTWSLTIYASTHSRQGGPTTLPHPMTLSTCLEMGKTINAEQNKTIGLFCSNHETGEVRYP